MSQPFSTGLLLCPFGIGCVVAMLSPVDALRQTRACLVLAAVAYARLAATSMLSDASVLWSVAACLPLLGFATASIAVRGRPFRSKGLLPEAGFTLGSLVAFALPDVGRRTGDGIDTADLSRSAAIAAAACVAATLYGFLATAEGRRIAGSDDARREESPPILYAASTALTLAMTTAVTVLMLWETFGWGPSKTGLFIAIWGGVALASHQVLERTAKRPGMHVVIAGLGLVITGFGNLGLVCTLTLQPPSLAALWLSVVFIAVGWGFIRWTLNRRVMSERHAVDRDGSSRLANLTVSAMVAIGPLLSLSVFRDHERTAFSLCGVALAVGLVDVIRAWRRRRTSTLAGAAVA